MLAWNGVVFAVLQATVLPEMQGRVFTLINSLVSGISPLSLAVAGPLADQLGIRFWYVLGGVVCIILGSVVLFIPNVVNAERLSAERNALLLAERGVEVIVPPSFRASLGIPAPTPHGGKEKASPLPWLRGRAQAGKGEFFALSYSTDFAPECDNRARFILLPVFNPQETLRSAVMNRLIAQNRRRCEPLPRWIGRAPRRAEAETSPRVAELGGPLPDAPTVRRT